MHPVSFEVEIKSRNYLISIDESLMIQLLEIAELQKVPVESLINSWLSEKLLEVS